MILSGEVSIFMKLERISGVFNNDNKFDIDLAKAQIREEELANILENNGTIAASSKDAISAFSMMSDIEKLFNSWNNHHAVTFNPFR